MRWLLWVVVLGPLIAIGFIRGREWAGRLKWIGGVAVVCAVIVYAGIAIGSPFIIDYAIDRIPDYESDIRAEFRANYPRLTAELISDEPVERLRRALDSLLRGWRNQTVPWIFTGVLLFAVGIAWPRVETWRSGRTVPRPPIPKSSGSGPSSSAESSSETPSAKVVDPPVSVEEKHDVGDGAKREATGSEPDSDPDR